MRITMWITMWIIKYIMIWRLLIRIIITNIIIPCVLFSPFHHKVYDLFHLTFTLPIPKPLWTYTKYFNMTTLPKWRVKAYDHSKYQPVTMVAAVGCQHHVGIPWYESIAYTEKKLLVGMDWTTREGWWSRMEKQSRTSRMSSQGLQDDVEICEVCAGQFALVWWLGDMAWYKLEIISMMTSARK